MQWPVGIGAKGNEGVANNVGNTKGSLGYVEYAYALQNKLTYTKMMNKAGKTVAPTSEAFQAAAANADWKSQPGYGVILANQPGDQSWPMTAATWILVYKHPVDPAATGEALKFFAWAYKNGAKMAESLDYVPMPASVAADVEKYWKSEVKDSTGKPVFAMPSDPMTMGKGRPFTAPFPCPPPPTRWLVLRPLGRLSGSPGRARANGRA